MRKKTYRALIILAVVVVVISVAVAVAVRFQQHKIDPKVSGTTAVEPSIDSNYSPEHEDNQTYTQPTLPEGSSFEIHFFNVGEGDSALVECDEHYMLIDGGNPSSSSFLYSYLKQHDIEYLDYVVCSHPHTDHVGGLAGALNYSTVGIAYSPVTEFDNRAFNSFVKYLFAQNKAIVVPASGDTITLGSATVEFIGPLDMTLAELNMNNSSIILRIEYGNTSFLFTGDAETDEELSLVASGIELQSTLLKVGHHGSYTSSSEAFLSAVAPEYAVISVGKGNEYGHPHDVVLDRLSKYCSVIYRTDLLGEIVCRSDGSSLTFDFTP